MALVAADETLRFWRVFGACDCKKKEGGHPNSSLMATLKLREKGNDGGPERHCRYLRNNGDGGARWFSCASDAASRAEGPATPEGARGGVVAPGPLSQLPEPPPPPPAVHTPLSRKL